MLRNFLKVPDVRIKFTEAQNLRPNGSELIDGKLDGELRIVSGGDEDDRITLKSPYEFCFVQRLPSYLDADSLYASDYPKLLHVQQESIIDTRGLKEVFSLPVNGTLDHELR